MCPNSVGKMRYNFNRVIGCSMGQLYIGMIKENGKKGTKKNQKIKKSEV